jgi:Uma2 family endonuclease
MAAGARLNEQLRVRPCAVAGSDLRLYCKPANILTYPDLVVFCEPAQVMDHDADTLADAVVIIEVFSPSTQNYDRGEKFRFYRRLPSFCEYVLLPRTQFARNITSNSRMAHGCFGNSTGRRKRLS